MKGDLSFLGAVNRDIDINLSQTTILILTSLNGLLI